MIDQKPAIIILKKDVKAQYKKYAFLTERKKQKEEKRARNEPKRVEKQRRKQEEALQAEQINEKALAFASGELAGKAKLVDKVTGKTTKPASAYVC